MTDPKIDVYRKIAASQAVTLDAAMSRDVAELIRTYVKLETAAGGGPLCPECGPLRLVAGGSVAEGHFETCRLAPFLPYPHHEVVPRRS
jgi:hypothetical protein